MYAIIIIRNIRVRGQSPRITRTSQKLILAARRRGKRKNTIPQKFAAHAHLQKCHRGDTCDFRQSVIVGLRQLQRQQQKHNGITRVFRDVKSRSVGKRVNLARRDGFSFLLLLFVGRKKGVNRLHVTRVHHSKVFSLFSIPFFSFRFIPAQEEPVYTVRPSIRNRTANTRA